MTRMSPHNCNSDGGDDRNEATFSLHLVVSDHLIYITVKNHISMTYDDDDDDHNTVHVDKQMTYVSVHDTNFPLHLYFLHNL